MSPTQPTSGGKGYASSRRSTAIPVRSADKKRVAGVLEPIPAIIGQEAGYTLDWSPANRRAHIKNGDVTQWSPTGPTSCKRWKQARGTTGGHPPAARAGDPAGTAPAPTEHGRVTITPPILPRRSPQWSPNPPHPQDQKGVKKVPPLQTPEQQTQGHEKNIPTPCMCPHHPNRSKMCKNTNKNK
ncbi:uncharacterized protein LOC133471306 isoform X1 [Phyllopteryx taeniolatus]|uniref:uncharacterized protein LOC133471306 isoform X1 n=1 Tax=Phyllopteryx taeniolatus TaxID=161469 RepID=UPI002AD4B3DC|nr:uncharacterized protein LOC133471306 isoform X1 [Phyllopteryx taeniolatus]